MKAILAKNLSKKYWFYEKEAGLSGSIRSLFRGRKVLVEAVRKINLEVDVGGVLGLIGIAHSITLGIAASVSKNVVKGMRSRQRIFDVIADHTETVYREELQEVLLEVPGVDDQLAMEITDSLGLEKSPVETIEEKEGELRREFKEL